MMSQTHVLISAAALTRRDAPVRNTAALLGAMLPDLSIYAIYLVSRLRGIESRLIWDEVYWQEPSQTLSAISNSFPIFAAVLIPAIYLQRTAQQERWVVVGTFFAALAISSLLHLVFDISLHADDAHRHFWPLTDWRFHSPVSYWDSRYYGNIVQVVELVLGILLVLILWRRFRAVWVRAILGIALSVYVLVPLYFFLTLG